MNNTGIIDNDTPIAIGPNIRIPEDWHRLLLVRRGAARLSCGGAETVALGGSIALIGPGAAVRVAAGTGAEIILAGFGRGILDPAALGADAEGLLRMLGAAEHGRENPLLVMRLERDAFGAADALMKKMEAEARQKGPGFQTMMKLSLMELLMVLYRSLAGKGQTAPEAARFRVEDAVRYIEDRFSGGTFPPADRRAFRPEPQLLLPPFCPPHGAPPLLLREQAQDPEELYPLETLRHGHSGDRLFRGVQQPVPLQPLFQKDHGGKPREYRKRVKT